MMRILKTIVLMLSGLLSSDRHTGGPGKYLEPPLPIQEEIGRKNSRKN